MHKKYEDIYIALGANLSNPQETFLRALKALKSKGVDTEEVSGLWQSPAWPPGSEQPDYINAAAKVTYAGTADALLAILHAVEAEFGRLRGKKNAARTLDLDLLDFKGRIINTTGLEIPHPRMLTRAFVLFPLQEIAPDWRDPVRNMPIIEHIAKLHLADVSPLKWRGRLNG